MLMIRFSESIKDSISSILPRTKGFVYAETTVKNKRKIIREFVFIQFGQMTLKVDFNKPSVRNINYKISHL